MNVHLCCRTKVRSAASIILRGANDFMCDEMERSVHDALCVVRRVLESKTVVPGGGAVEAALSIYLENYATSMVSAVGKPTGYFKITGFPGSKLEIKCVKFNSIDSYLCYFYTKSHV